MKWYCSSALCSNNFSTRDSHGNPIKYYRLPREESIQNDYRKIFKTDGFNWQNGHICAEHWSTGERQTSSHLPDVPVPQEHLEKLKLKYERSKLKSPSSSTSKVNAKRKYDSALSAYKSPPASAYKRKEVQKYETPVIIRKKALSKPQLRKKILVLEKTNTELESELEKLKTQLEEKSSEIKKLTEKVNNLEKCNSILTKSNTDFSIELLKKKFCYEQILLDEKLFKYICGLSKEQFYLLYECVEPYLHAVPYANEVTSKRSLSFDSKTQLLITLVICRHGLDLGMAAFIAGKCCTSTISRIFTSWVLFLATLFNKIDLNPENGFIMKKMPKVFWETGHEETDLVIDATEFKFQQASNYDLSSLMFSNYKNTMTGKALIGIAPRDIYPGSISDSEITEKTNILQYVNYEREIMSDKGFAIQELCTEKGIFLNRPKQKDSDQFLEKDVQKNFDIASTRIHVERFIGRVRNFNILNNIWPMNRIDLLSSTWQMLCHIVNITMPPVGPKE